MIDHTFAIVAYGNSPYLEECIQSVLNQNVLGKVIICTSTPSRLITSLAEKYSIRMLINSHSAGIADDWNFALRQSDAQFVTLAHQDDIYDEDYLSACSEYFNTEFQILFTCYREVFENDIKTVSFSNRMKSLLLFPFFIKNRISNRWIKRGVIRFGNSIGCPGVIYNRNKLVSFQFSSDFKNNLDWFAWAELSNTGGEFVFLKQRLYTHRIHVESVTASSLDDHSKEVEDLIMFTSFWNKKVAGVIHKFYKMSYKTYKIC